MQTVKIGIIDSQREYVEKLTTYLSQYGKGKWSLSGYTDWEKFLDQMKRNYLDVVVATNISQLRELKKDYIESKLLWLGEDGNYQDEFAYVNRYMGAKEVAHSLKRIIGDMKKDMFFSTPAVAIYSPIGRCGKTTLAYSVTKDEKYGKWIYVGMEDYSSNPMDLMEDDFLYFCKEQKETEMIDCMEKKNGNIVVSQSLLEIRQLSKEDIKWFLKIVERHGYRGVIFDIGSGVLKDYQMFGMFDTVLVPYLIEETSLRKLENFKQLLMMYGYEQQLERMIFLDMDNENIIRKSLDKLFLPGGDAW